MNEPSTLRGVRDELRALPAPVIVFNKSHSGSRLLADILAAAGKYMGAHLNESNDSLDLLELVTWLVDHYYPDDSRCGGRPPPRRNMTCPPWSGGFSPGT